MCYMNENGKLSVILVLRLKSIVNVYCTISEMFQISILVTLLNYEKIMKNILL